MFGNMFGLIWFAVVLYIVVRAVKKSKANTVSKTNVQKRTTQVKHPNPQPQVNWGTAQRQSGGPAPKHTQYAGRKNTASGSAAGKSTSENSILEKAKQHAKEQFSDDVLACRGPAELNRVPVGDEIMKDKAKAGHIHSEHAKYSHDTELRNQAGVDDLDTYHLIEEVNDLIVKGYSGNLDFERDFIAEGTDMLNRMYG